MRGKTELQPVNEEQKQLVAKNFRLAGYLVVRFLKQYPESRFAFDDFYSNACEAMLHAARKFDPNRGFQFATLARKFILGVFRNQKRKIDLRCGRETPWEDAFPGGIGPVTIGKRLARLEEEDWDALVRPLPEACQFVLYARYRLGLSPQRAALELGIPRSAVDIYEARAVRGLKRRKAVLSPGDFYG
ncbi:sigma-70 family RNA polymerase sigma factor [Tuwongella immobilis]|uniref:Subfamily rna polymerase sigma-28 subunit:: Sigma70_r2 n=1 Tax=Tuwongella immobilis TaxID=692036 RepID=A0A6C2YNW1_9BACT|nr:sigma-70 family RNA polymerase sigma factor [Tuwongella immobilis]VIP02981.1 subfamily rna polymerase sigma-28 subunit : : Sigma70_r2 [Tuwongella immobilis]VTS03031.1 subfamily rna polymerase sigma-28 subunit : : Sigma70_r2 [Tuwongella immobilis]